MCLVDLLQHMWRTGEIPQELVWMILVLITKETTDTRGIVLLETLWKVVEALIDTCLHVSLQMHGVLHKFRSRRGMGASIMELKLARELSRIYPYPLFLVFLDFWKAYDTVDWDRLLITLEVFGVGRLMCGFLETFWDCWKVVPRQNGFHWPAFLATRGTT